MKLKPGAWVRIEKVSAVKKPRSPTPDKDTYKYGQHNEGMSIPNEYWLEGFLMSPIKKGQSVQVTRYIRNGVEIFGSFESTPVVSVTKNTFTTANSKYKVTVKQIPVEYTYITS